MKTPNICDCMQMNNEIIDIEMLRFYLGKYGSAIESVKNTVVEEWDFRTHQCYYFVLEFALARICQECTLAWAINRAQEYVYEKENTLTLHDYLGLPGGSVKFELKCGGHGAIQNSTDSLQCFWGFARKDEENNCILNMQIHDSKKLYICCELSDVNGKISDEHHTDMFAKVNRACSKFPEIRIEKSHGEAKGQSFKLAEVFFGANTYMVLKENGTICLVDTVERLQTVRELIFASCK